MAGDKLEDMKRGLREDIRQIMETPVNNMVTVIDDKILLQGEVVAKITTKDERTQRVFTQLVTKVK